MKIVFNKIKEHISFDDLSYTNNSLIFIGEGIDTRSINTIAYLRSKYTYILEILYQNSTNSFLINECDIRTNDIKATLLEYINEKDVKHIILEGTSMGYPEILTILQILNSLQIKLNITILYTEPIKYKSNTKNLTDETYELSEDYHQHKYIKPFILKEPHDSTSNKQATLITFVGFEENRLGRVLNQNSDDNKYNEFIYVLPIPGFQFGWENISLSKHYHLLGNNKEIHYTPADDPYETYKVLDKITANLKDRKIVIMPFSTKPCTIGTCIFLVNKKLDISMNASSKDEIATKYDFPIKSKDRTSGISTIYEYKLKIE